MSWDMKSVVEHRIEIAGHATRALEVDGGGPGIVLLHGWGDSADTWRPLLAQLGARGTPTDQNPRKAHRQSDGARTGQTHRRTRSDAPPPAGPPSREPGQYHLEVGFGG